MSKFTALELAALDAIFLETPDLNEALRRQLRFARVVKRENSGGGFFTDISVAPDASALACDRVLGKTTRAKVAGLSWGMGFVLFMDHGKLSLLEGYAFAPEDTSALDLEDLTFEVTSGPYDLHE
ncbi:MAG: hypothetical protein JSR28_10575 [Proteobacteria bacterium]|nr:hypothetical protein [Pseudomonadota bacterium]